MTQTLLSPTHKVIPQDEATPLVQLEDVSWEFYERLLKELERNHRHVRVSYDDGRLEIMTLTNRHEQNKTLVARLVELYAMERNLDIIGVGSVTLKRKERRKGCEPDECYYVQTPAPGPKVMQLNLKKYPPPDLAIEIDITSGSMDRQPIYGAIGVPEIWRYDGIGITVLHRRRDGKYRAALRSLAFPKLPMGELNRFLVLADQTNQSQAARAFRDWLRQNPAQQK